MLSRNQEQKRCTKEQTSRKNEICKDEKEQTVRQKLERNRALKRKSENHINKKKRMRKKTKNKKFKIYGPYKTDMTERTRGNE